MTLSNLFWNKLPLAFALLFVSLFFTISGNSQEAGKHQLLWKIEHKNSNKVSYLFGTIHLQDQRVFNFSDSLIPALKRSEAFALEIHPDSIMSGLMQAVFKTENQNIYKEVLTPEEYDLLSKRFLEVNNTSLDGFYTKNPFIIEAMLVPKVSKKNDMPNFLDGHLYGIAHNNNLAINGLEKIEDQIRVDEIIDPDTVRKNILDILAQSDSENLAFMEQLIALYVQGDLVALLDFINEGNGMDKIMKQRNLVMVNSMINIMQSQSLFTAVGAAHLPGDDGIIALLRKRGYTVNPVAATFNNKKVNRQLTPNLATWITNEYADFGFTLKTPIPVVESTKKSEGLAFYTSDLISGTNFGYFVYNLGNLDESGDIDLSELLFSYFMENDLYEITRQEDITLNGKPFTEVVVNNKEVYTRYLIGKHNNLIYVFLTESVYSAIDSPYNNAFFDSIIIKDLPTQPTNAKTSKTWVNFKMPKAGFAVDLPEGKVVPLKQETPNPLEPDAEPYIINMYSVINPSSDFNYFVRYNDQPIGYYAQDQSDLEADLIEIFGPKASIYKKAEPISVNGIQGVSMQFLVQDEYHIVIQLLMNGNRTYLLMQQANRKDLRANPDSRFFTSFELLVPQTVKFSKTVTVKDQFNIVFPENVKLFETDSYSDYEEFELTENYAAIAEETGDVYMMQVTRLSELYRTINADSFFKDSFDLALEEGDSIIAINDRVLDGFPGKTAIIKNSATNVIQITHIMYVNNYLITLYGYIGPNTYQDKSYNTFFNSFKKIDSAKKTDITKSKVKELVARLTSKDTLKVNQAVYAMYYHDFDNNDLPALIKALESNIIIVDATEDPKDLLVETIAKYGGKKELDQLVRFYNSKKANREIKMSIVKNMLTFKDAEADTSLMELLLKNPPERTESSGYYVFYQLEDSLALLKKHAPKLNTLYTNNNFKDQLVGLYANQILNEPDAVDYFTALQNSIITQIPKNISAYSDTIQRKANHYLNVSLISNYITLAERDPAIDAKTSGEVLKLIYQNKEPDNWVITEALLKAITMGYTIDADILNRYVSNYYSRYEVMEALAQVEQLDLVPNEYLQADEYTYLCVYNTVGAYDDNYNHPITKLGTIAFEGKTYVAYKASMGSSPGQDDRLYIGLYQAANPKTLEYVNVYLDTQYASMSSEDWQIQAKKIVKEGLIEESMYND